MATISIKRRHLLVKLTTNSKYQIQYVCLDIVICTFVLESVKCFQQRPFFSIFCSWCIGAKKQTVMDIWNILCRERRRSSWPLKLEGSQRQRRRWWWFIRENERRKKRKKKGGKVSLATQWQNTTTYREFHLSHYYKSSTAREMKRVWA